MGLDTTIEWTEATWNPIRGCTRVSEGCRNCYAMRIAARFTKPGMAYEGLAKMAKNGPRWTGIVRLVEKRLFDPLHWKDPRRIFVNSMGDLFHGKIADQDIQRVFRVMASAPRHTFQILTKRPARMLNFVLNHQPRPLPNVWIGISIEDQATADERVRILRNIPAAVRWISAEPLLAPIALNLDYDPSLPKIDWLVCGGESGPKARPMKPRWVRNLRDECRASGVNFFFKQWGVWLPEGQHGVRGINASDVPIRVGKKAAGRLLDGEEWSWYPKVA